MGMTGIKAFKAKLEDVVNTLSKWGGKLIEVPILKIFLQQ